ncbi:hypothetical protein CLPU_5c00250 [Gottschalkia purinilytica]|uniref:Uncharacterized protein n=1 Tax=Gottschalkia purinilytica TaxID=1503 RepID=A0A0L0WB41_GOTPU|nr:hypothetical protein [Gottschalkia purinilytica]KNF08718.1 hypothetical protein CLPU_5c00250 [Gottschalkia purinilytica]
MTITNLQILLITFFVASIIGYICVVIKEKINLKSNTIIIDKKSVTQDQIDEAEVKVFMLDGEEIKAGDEVKVTLSSNKRVEGIIIGAKMSKSEIVIVTHSDEIEKFKVDTIKRIKIISKYGRFFKIF